MSLFGADSSSMLTMSICVSVPVAKLMADLIHSPIVSRRRSQLTSGLQVPARGAVESHGEDQARRPSAFGRCEQL